MRVYSNESLAFQMKMFSTRCKNDETFYGMVLKHIFDKQIINGIVDTELATLQHYLSHLVSVGIELTLVGGIEVQLSNNSSALKQSLMIYNSPRAIKKKPKLAAIKSKIFLKRAI